MQWDLFLSLAFVTAFQILLWKLTFKRRFPRIKPGLYFRLSMFKHLREMQALMQFQFIDKRLNKFASLFFSGNFDLFGNFIYSFPVIFLSLNAQLLELSHRFQGNELFEKSFHVLHKSWLLGGEILNGENFQLVRPYWFHIAF